MREGRHCRRRWGTALGRRSRREVAGRMRRARAQRGGRWRRPRPPCRLGGRRGRARPWQPLGSRPPPSAASTGRLGGGQWGGGSEEGDFLLQQGLERYGPDCGRTWAELPHRGARAQDPLGNPGAGGPSQQQQQQQQRQQEDVGSSAGMEAAAHVGGAPTTKKRRWSKEEDDLLRQGLERYGQDFSKIREHLLPHRTWSQIQKHHHNHIEKFSGDSSSFAAIQKTGRWSKEEDDLLRQGLQQYGKDYGKIREHLLPRRSWNQIKMHHDNHVEKFSDDPSLVAAQPRKRRWSPQEDDLLRQGLQQYGRDYSKIRDRLLPKRTRQQIQTRHHNHLEKFSPDSSSSSSASSSSSSSSSSSQPRKVGLWTEEEDDLMRQGLERYGQDYSKIREHLLPHRSRNQIQMHYHNHVEKFSGDASSFAVAQKTGPWSLEEDDLLRQGLERYGPDYSKIREHLLPHRSRNQIQKHYLNRMNAFSEDAPAAAIRQKVGRWSPEEDDLLRQGLERYGPDYSKIREHLLPHRSRNQIQKHYRNHIEMFSPDAAPGKDVELKTGRWSKEEDELLRQGLQQYGRDYGKIREHFLPRRTWNQIQMHHRDNAEKLSDEPAAASTKRKTGRWSPQEDYLLRQGLQQYGRDYGKIREHFLPHRTWKQISDHHRNHIEKFSLPKGDADVSSSAASFSGASSSGASSSGTSSSGTSSSVASSSGASAATTTPVRKGKRWTPEEDDLLRQGLERYGQDYSKIREHLLPHRARSQIVQHVRDYAEKFSEDPAPDAPPHKTGAWSQEEDDLLRQGLEQFGRDFGQIREQLLPHRSRKQIADHQRNHIEKFSLPKGDADASPASSSSSPSSAASSPEAASPSLAKAPARKGRRWTPEEDNLLRQGLEQYGRDYSKIREHFLSNRSRNQILQHHCKRKGKFCDVVLPDAVAPSALETWPDQPPELSPSLQSSDATSTEPAAERAGERADGGDAVGGGDKGVEEGAPQRRKHRLANGEGGSLGSDADGGGARQFGGGNGSGGDGNGGGSRPGDGHGGGSRPRDGNGGGSRDDDGSGGEGGAFANGVMKDMVLAATTGGYGTSAEVMLPPSRYEGDVTDAVVFGDDATSAIHGGSNDTGHDVANGGRNGVDGAALQKEDAGTGRREGRDATNDGGSRADEMPSDPMDPEEAAASVGMKRPREEPDGEGDSREQKKHRSR